MLHARHVLKGHYMRRQFRTGIRRRRLRVTNPRQTTWYSERQDYRQDIPVSEFENPAFIDHARDVQAVAVKRAPKGCPVSDSHLSLLVYLAPWDTLFD